MKEETIRTLLRLIAVMTMFAGVCYASASLILTGDLQGGVSGMMPENQAVLLPFFRSFGYQAALSYLATAFWGFVLYVVSPRLARAVASHPPQR